MQLCALRTCQVLRFHVLRLRVTESTRNHWVAQAAVLVENTNKQKQTQYLKLLHGSGAWSVLVARKSAVLDLPRLNQFIGIPLTAPIYRV